MGECLLVLRLFCACESVVHYRGNLHVILGGYYHKDQDNVEKGAVDTGQTSRPASSSEGMTPHIYGRP